MLGMIRTMPAREKSFAREYLHAYRNKDLAQACIRAALSSVADTAVIPMQDYLELGSEARINIPSTLGDNWKWRMDENALSDELAERIYHMAKVYGRL